MTGASKIDEKTPHSANRILKFPSNVPSFCSERPQGASRNKFSVVWRQGLGLVVAVNDH